MNGIIGLRMLHPGLVPRLRLFPGRMQPAPKAPKGAPADWIAPYGDRDEAFDKQPPMDFTRWPLLGKFSLTEWIRLGLNYPFWQDGRILGLEEIFRRLASGEIKFAEFADAALPFLRNNAAHTLEYEHINEAVILLLSHLDPSLLAQLADGPMVKSGDPAIRAGIAEAIGLSHQIGLATNLARAAKDSDPGVRATALRGLAAMPGPDAVAAAVKALGDSDERVQEAAADALAALGASEAVDALTKLARSGKPRGQSAALEALGKLSGAAARGDLIAALKAGAYEARIGALRGLYALGKSGDWSWVPDAAALLADKDWEVRRVALRVLWFSRQPEAVAPIMAALGHERGDMLNDVRRALLDMLNDASGSGAGDLGTDPKAWSAWWADNRGRWKIPPIGTSRVKIEDAGSTAARWQAPKPEPSGDIVFVIGASGSTSEMGKLAAEESRIADTVEAMTPDSWFRVLAWRFLSAKQPPGDGKLIMEIAPAQASSGAKQSVREQVRKVTPLGWNQVLAPIEKAVSDRRFKRVVLVYLVNPNRGTGGNWNKDDASADRLMRRIADATRYHPVRIDGYGAGWLKRVADQERGTYNPR